MEGLIISLVQTDDDLLDIVPLKQDDDNQALKRMRLESQTEDQTLEKILRLKFKGYDFWIARLNGEAIGYATGELQTNGSYRSEGIYVKPEQRRKGYGTEIKRTQIVFAKELGCTELVSNVSGDNVASLRVQEKCGISAVPNERTGGYFLSLKLSDA